MTGQNERKSEQAHIPHAPTLLENAVYKKWQPSISDKQSDRKPVHSYFHFGQISKFKKDVTPRK